MPSEVDRLLAPLLAQAAAASRTEDLSGLLDIRRDAEGEQRGSGADGEERSRAGAEVAEELRRLNQQVDQLRGVQSGSLDLLRDNTAAILQNTVVRESDGGSRAKSVGKGLASILTSGFGLSPLISGLTGLFRRSENPPEPEMVRYAAPLPQRPKEALTPGGLAEYDYDQSGLPRLMTEARPAPAAPQITVQVQAIDSRSFLDHREEIARAVREAMLESRVLSDTIAEL